MSIIQSRRPDGGGNGRWWNVNLQHIYVGNTIDPPPTHGPTSHAMQLYVDWHALIAKRESFCNHFAHFFHDG